MNRILLTLLLPLAAVPTARAQNADEIARQVANPIASLTSVPLQFNDEYDAGVNGDGHRLRINVQPVIPISIGPIGQQLVSVQAGGAYYVEAPSGGPGWGARLTVTFLYPKH